MTVYLVGAGPGDPGLITVRAAELLQTADVILYDQLIPQVLIQKYASIAAQLHDVGTAPNQSHEERQQRIFSFFKSYSQEGKTVVRLKGGDPFIFARGVEEVTFLQAHAIPYEVVPGVSSVTGAPTSGQIPLTDRHEAAAFAVFTAHQCQGNPSVDWELAARIPTAVFLMGASKLGWIVEQLRIAGKSAETPVGIVERGSWPTQKVIRGTLGTIEKKAEEITSPAIIIVGNVVNLCYQNGAIH